MPPPIPPDPVGDPELARLIDAHGGELYGVGVARVGDPTGVAWDARLALLDYIAAHYVRRDLFTPSELHWREWSAAHPARGILPWQPGDELPEERIRRLRDGDRQHTLYLDDAGDGAGGVGDFEGE